MTVNWTTCRRAVLRDGLWKFAKKYLSMTADTTYTANSKWQYRFQLPQDFIRLVSLNNQAGNFGGDEQDIPYRVEGSFIYTNMSYANLVYIYDIKNYDSYEPLFDEALASYVAAKICFNLTASESQRESLMKVYKEQMQKARFVDSVEDPSVQLDSDIWGPARLGVSGLFRDPPFAQAGPINPGNEYYGNVNPNGVQIGNVGDSYYQINNTTNQLIQQWLKTSNSGQNTGWVQTPG